MSTELHTKCKSLLEAFKSGKLGQTVMPEDSNPGFSDKENEWRIAFLLCRWLSTTSVIAINYE